MTTDPRRRRRRRAITLVLSTAVLTVIAGAAAWWLLRDRTPDLDPAWMPVVSVFAGDGVPAPRDGAVHRSRFSEPYAVAVGQDGSVFVADAGEAHRIRRISTEGFVTTLAGGVRGFADGRGSAARFDTPSALAVAPDGALLVADTGNNAIRRVALDGSVTTLAGEGPPGDSNGAGRAARFNAPLGIAVDAAGRVIVADSYNDRIRAITPAGEVTTLAGGGVPGLADGYGSAALFDTPCGLTVDAEGTVYVADSGNGVIRRIDIVGAVTTVTGSDRVGLAKPIGITRGAEGEIYVTEEHGRVIEIAAGGFVRTLAGSSAGFSNGTGVEARFRRPAGVAWIDQGRLLVADSGNALVRLLSAPGRGLLRPPAPPVMVAPAFDETAFAQRPLLWPVAPMDGPHEVAGTMGESRGGEGTERFHSGIDIRIDHGTPVLAVREGVVASPFSTGAFGTLNEWLRVGDLTYVHLRAGRDRQSLVDDLSRFVPTYDETGQLARIRVKRGARFDVGETIGSVNQFNHVHLNVGWSGEELNPLAFAIPNFEDTISPTIARRGVRLFDEQMQPLARRTRGRLEISGRVHVVVDAWDLSNENRPGRRLGLYALGYQLLKPDGSPAPGFETPRETIRFDRMSHDPEDVRLVFAPGSGIPFYGRRVTRFLYQVTNAFRDGAAEPGIWDTTLLPPGPYVLRIHASDIRGNVAKANRDLPVLVVAPEAHAAPGAER